MIDLTANCVAHYKMNDDAASTVVIDSQGHSNGTAQQNTEDLTTTGKVNDALTFNGTSDYINTNSDFKSVFQSDFSISAWIKPTDGQPSVDKGIFGTFDSSPLSGVNLYISTVGGEIKFYYSVGSEYKTITASSLLDDGQETWHFLVAIAEQVTSTTVKLSIYFDGDLAKTDTFTCDMGDFSGLETLFIGQMNFNGNPIAEEYFEGDIDNVMVFDRVLSQSEIDFLYSNGNGTEHLDSGAMPAGMLTETWGF